MERLQHHMGQNFEHQPKDHMAVAEALKDLREELVLKGGKKRKIGELAKLVDRSDIWVRDHLNCLDLVLEVQGMMRPTLAKDVRLSHGAAHLLAELAVPLERQVPMAKYIVSHHLTVIDARAYIEGALRRAETRI
jgi:hypothetical protein